jgi:hypothetical protein
MSSATTKVTPAAVVAQALLSKPQPGSAGAAALSLLSTTPPGAAPPVPAARGPPAQAQVPGSAEPAVLAPKSAYSKLNSLLGEHARLAQTYGESVTTEAKLKTAETSSRDKLLTGFEKFIGLADRAVAGDPDALLPGGVHVGGGFTRFVKQYWPWLVGVGILLILCVIGGIVGGVFASRSRASDDETTPSL